MGDVSVITVCLNSINTIRCTLESVHNQGEVVHEHIIIDGCSSDGTLEFIERFKTKSSSLQLYTEAANGIYSAINKGLEVASSEWICLLHSDDQFYCKNTLKKMLSGVGRLENVIYADLEFYKNDVRVRTWTAGSFDRNKLKFGWVPPHPTLLIRRDYAIKIGLYLESYRISSDFDYCLRVFSDPDCRPYYFSHPSVKMLVGGVSTAGIKNTFVKFLEDISIMRRHQINPIVGIFYKKIFKIPQLID